MTAALAATAPAGDLSARLVESVVVRGDLSGLSPEDKARHYLQLCEQLGLNPATQPIAFLRLQNREVAYVRREGTDQLAALHRLNREIIDGPRVIDVAGTKLVYAVCRITHPNGRFETSTATMPLQNIANVLMAVESKAKRRATLSILGLGAMDETEHLGNREARVVFARPVNGVSIPVAEPDDGSADARRVEVVAPSDPPAVVAAPPEATREDAPLSPPAGTASRVVDFAAMDGKALLAAASLDSVLGDSAVRRAYVEAWCARIAKYDAATAKQVRGKLAAVPEALRESPEWDAIPAAFDSREKAAAKGGAS